MMNKKLKEQTPIAPLQANKWATLRHEIKGACNKNWTDEEIHLHECAASGFDIRLGHTMCGDPI